MWQSQPYHQNENGKICFINIQHKPKNRNLSISNNVQRLFLKCPPIRVYIFVRIGFENKGTLWDALHVYWFLCCLRQFSQSYNVFVKPIPKLHNLSYALDYIIEKHCFVCLEKTAGVYSWMGLFSCTSSAPMICRFSIRYRSTLAEGTSHLSVRELFPPLGGTVRYDVWIPWSCIELTRTKITYSRHSRFQLLSSKQTQRDDINILQRFLITAPHFQFSNQLHASPASHVRMQVIASSYLSLLHPGGPDILLPTVLIVYCDYP